MGSARNRSWSITRHNLYTKCPRAYFYEYFPWGEPEQDILWFLKRVKSVQLLAGDIVHELISLALRQFHDKGVVTDLLVPAANQFDLRVKESLRIAEIVKSGKKPPSKGSVLAHHLEVGASECMELAGKASVEDALRAFEISEAWEVIRNSEPRLWVKILTDTDPKPYFEVSEKLGFQRALGLRAYSVYDFAFRHRKEFVIVDWKTGEKSSYSIANTKLQTAVYSLWAMNQGVKGANIRIQPFFLQLGEAWSPQPVSEEALDEVREMIQDHDSLMRDLVIREDKGEKMIFHAKRLDFPPKANPNICRGCKFRSICPEGSHVCCSQ